MVSMAKAELMKGDEIVSLPIFDLQRGGARGQLMQNKIDILEGLTSKVSNRRSRRWLNDRFLIELVPCLSDEEIRGLFAPPPWGEDKPVSAFCMKNMDSWDKFRNVDMDAEACLIQAFKYPGSKGKSPVNTCKRVALMAWKRVNHRTREALRRNFLSDIVSGYEGCIREFIMGSEKQNALVLHVQDPFHRLLLHGVCEFYNLASVTISNLKDGKLLKMTTIERKPGTVDIPTNISLVQFLKMAREGTF